MKKKMSKCEAKRVARRAGVDFSDDFHVLSSSRQHELVALAKKVGYRKPKSASGSRARYFFYYLQKARCSGLSSVRRRKKR